MAERKVGTVILRQTLSPILSLFRLMPQPGSRFPEYKPGQYIALRRDDCKLTQRVVDANGQVHFFPVLDEHGNLKRGPVTHSYSISSAPFETVEQGFLEFYVILEKEETGEPGRLTESLFRIDPAGDNQLTYVDRITGDFTLEKRAEGYQSVLLVGTGTGLAPFASMIKQLRFEASQGKVSDLKYTLLHTNRTYEELGYHQELLTIEAEQKFDFVYIPSVSRPTPRDWSDPGMGKGRANNLLRSIFVMSLKEEEMLSEATARQGDVQRAKAALDKIARPVFPQRVSRNQLQDRFNPSCTVILSCGNPLSMADIKAIANANQIRFEKEDW